MPTLTRRAAIKATAVSSLAFGAESTGLPQASPNAGSPAAPTMLLDPDLHTYVNDRLMTVMSRIHQGSASQQDLRDAADHLHLLADHHTDSGFDAAMTEAALSLSPAQLASAPAIDMTGFEEYARSFGLDISTTMLNSMEANTASADDVKAFQEHLHSAGISGFFHQFADHLHAISGDARFSASAGSPDDHPQIQSALYNPRQVPQPHLLQVQSCQNPGSGSSGSNKPFFCTYKTPIAWDLLKTAINQVIQGCKSSGNTAFFFCEALLGYLARLGESVAGNLYAWGVIIVGGLILTICAGK